MSYTVADLNRAVGEWATAYAKTGEAEYLEDGEEYDGDDSSVWGEVEEFLYGKDKFILLPGIGELTLVKSHGGGEDYHLILRVHGITGEDRTFKRIGWYGSFLGGYLEGPTVEGKIVVKAVEVFE